MGKRFTATEKWDDPFFCELNNNDKLLWIYLLDKCDNAGIYDVNIKNLNFALDMLYTEKGILETFRERIQVLNGGSKWFIPKFIEFQYGELTSNCKPHIPVMDKLKKYGLKGYPKGIQTLQEKEKEQVQEKDKDKDKEIMAKMTEFELEVMLYKGEYPKEMLQAFWDYWSEPNKTRTKMRKELEKTWDTKRRLTTWANRSKDFKKPEKKEPIPGYLKPYKPLEGK